MRAKSGLLADAANFTSDGKLNLLGAFQMIMLREVPATYPLFVLVAVIRADSSEEGTEHQFTVELKDAEARLVYTTSTFSITIGTDTSMPFAEIYLAISVRNLMLPRFGMYEFHIVADGKHLHSIDLLVQPIVRPFMESADEQGGKTIGAYASH